MSKFNLAIVLSATALLFSFRCLLTIGALSRVHPSSVLLGILSTAALCTTALAWMRGTPDLTPRGLVVGFGHLTVLLLDPSGSPVLVWQILFWSLLGLQTWVRWSLGARCTVTGPVFVGVERSGLYAFVRHPMTAIELLIAVCVGCESPTPYNVVILVLVLASKITITLCEESFLNGFASYREYSAAVRWRWCPLLW